MGNRAFAFFKKSDDKIVSKRVLIPVVLFIFICQSLILISIAHANSGVLVAESNQASVSYSINGASLSSPENSKDERRGFFHYMRSYQGELTAGRLSISGTANTEPSNQKSWVNVSVSAGGETDSYSASFEGGTQESFSVSVPIPLGATSGSFSIRVTREVYFSTIGETRYDIVTVSGALSSEPEENRPPIVSLDYSPANPILGEPIEFTATASDPDGDPLTYEWYLNGDKTPAESSSVVWQSPSEGQHTLRVVVSDGKGGTADDSVTFEVTEEEEIEIGVSYRLGYEFPPDAERIMPLLLTFRVDAGPPGTYISRIVNITQGTQGGEAFHSGECYGPANPQLYQPTKWECGYTRINWPDVLTFAKNQTPIPFEAQVEVFAGYDGAEMVFKTIPLEFVIQLDGIASVMLLPPYSDNIIRERYTSADAELLDQPGNYMNTNNPLPVSQWKVVKPGQRVRVYSHSQVMTRCLSGMVWLIHRESSSVSSWDYVFGAEGIGNLSRFPVPQDKSYVEHAIKFTIDETLVGPAKQKVVTRLLGVGKTAAGRALGVLGFVLVDSPVGGHGVYAVRMRSEMVIDVHADGSITARTFSGAPDLIGGDGVEVNLPAGYETIMEEGTNRFSVPVSHQYDNAEELLPIPREFTGNEGVTEEKNSDTASSDSSSESGCFVGTLKTSR